MKAYVEVRSIDPVTFNIPIRWRREEWSASRPGRFIPGESFRGTHERGVSAGPTVALDYSEKKIINDRLSNRTTIPQQSNP